jgi:8-oxo-dGTP pyrophosphatase MutT (NUDIX family)
MLKFTATIPSDKPVRSVHCVPILDNGDLVMVWDREDKVLTTVGGRLEGNESILEGLRREALEEAGIELSDELTLFASWYWEEYGVYRLFYLAQVKHFVERPEGFETTGYVIMNFETALDMIEKIEGREERIQVIRRAGVLSGYLVDGNVK